MSEDVAAFVAETLGHKVKDKALFEAALTHSSSRGANYERLEFLGDRVLGLVMARWLYERFPDEDRDAHGHLVPASRALVEHIDTLSYVRQRLLAELQSLDGPEFARLRETGSGRLTPQWVLHHLCQHEAEHRGQIQTARTLLGAGSAR